MNDDYLLVRPLFRVLYGIVFIVCIVAIFLSLFNVTKMWKYEILNSWGLLAWSVFIGCQFIALWCAHITFIIAISGKPPTYLVKYIDKYK